MGLKIKWACAKQIRVKLTAVGGGWECESDTYGAKLKLMIS